MTLRPSRVTLNSTQVCQNRNSTLPMITTRTTLPSLYTSKIRTDQSDSVYQAIAGPCLMKESNNCENTSSTMLTHYLDTLEHKKHTTTLMNTSIGRIHTKIVSNIASNATHAKGPKHLLSYRMVSPNRYLYPIDYSHTSPWIIYPYHHELIL